MTREELEKVGRNWVEENRKHDIEETFLGWWFFLLFVVLEVFGLWMLRNGCSTDAIGVYAIGISVVIGMVVGLYSSQGAESWKRKLDAFLCCGFAGWLIALMAVFFLGGPVFLVAALYLGLIH